MKITLQVKEVEKELVNAARIAALTEGITLRAYVIRALTEYVAKDRPRTEKGAGK